jgi:hypothetical protein
MPPHAREAPSSPSTAQSSSRRARSHIKLLRHLTITLLALPPAASGAQLTPPPPNSPTEPILTDAERAFAAKLEHAVNVDRNPHAAAQLFSRTALLARARLPDDPTLNLDRFLAPFVLDGNLTLVRAELHGQTRQLLFRQRGKALNYARFDLTTAPDGTVLATDLYDLTVGASASEIFAHEASLSGHAPPATTRPIPPDLLLANQALANLLAQGKPKDLLAAFADLPVAVRADRWILELRYDAATRTSPQDQDRAIDDLSADFPDDPSVAFRSISSLARRAFFDAAIDRLDLVAKPFNDPLLDALRADVLAHAGKPNEALAAARRVITVSPSDVPTLMVMIRVGLGWRDYPVVSEALTHLIDDAHAHLKDLQRIPQFSDYLRSDEYQRWAAARQRNPDSATSRNAK